jgi:hypothetical protein
MKGINSTGATLVHVPGWMDGWVDGWVGGWVGVKAILRIAYSNQKIIGFSSVCIKLKCDSSITSTILQIEKFYNPMEFSVFRIQVMILT